MQVYLLTQFTQQSSIVVQSIAVQWLQLSCLLQELKCLNVIMSIAMHGQHVGKGHHCISVFGINPEAQNTNKQILATENIFEHYCKLSTCTYCT